MEQNGAYALLFRTQAERYLDNKKESEDRI
jgi:hypothetical protein